MSSEFYKLYQKNKVEIFEIIYDVCKRAPTPDSLSFLFGFETEKEKEEFNKKLNEYLKSEEPMVKAKFKELGFYNE